MKDVRSVMVGIIKQSVLKQIKKGEGVGKGKILYWRDGRYNNPRVIIIVIHNFAE